MNDLSCYAEQFDFILQIMRSNTDFERPCILLGECRGEKQDQRQENIWGANAAVYTRGDGGLN